MTKLASIRYSINKKLSDFYGSDFALFLAGFIRLIIQVLLFVNFSNNSSYVNGFFAFGYLFHLIIVTGSYLDGGPIYGRPFFYSYFFATSNLYALKKFFGKRANEIKSVSTVKSIGKRTKRVFLEMNDFSNGYFLYHLIRDNIGYRSYPKVYSLFKELQRILDQEEKIDPFFVDSVSKHLPLITELRDLESLYKSESNSYRKEDISKLMVLALEGLSDCLEKESEARIWALDYIERKEKTIKALIKESKENIGVDQMTLEK